MRDEALKMQNYQEVQCDGKHNVDFCMEQLRMIVYISDHVQFRKLLGHL